MILSAGLALCLLFGTCVRHDKPDENYCAECYMRSDSIRLAGSLVGLKRSSLDHTCDQFCIGNVSRHTLEKIIQRERAIIARHQTTAE